VREEKRRNKDDGYIKIERERERENTKEKLQSKDGFSFEGV